MNHNIDQNINKGEFIAFQANGWRRARDAARNGTAFPPCSPLALALRSLSSGALSSWRAWAVYQIVPEKSKQKSCTCS